MGNEAKTTTKPKQNVPVKPQKGKTGSSAEGFDLPEKKAPTVNVAPEITHDVGSDTSDYMRAMVLGEALMTPRCKKPFIPKIR